MRPHGHVRVSARSPQAAGVCDRCGRMFQLNTLIWQWDWAGERLQNLRILVCEPCLDVPQEQLRARILGPDPVPVLNARPEPFAPTGVNLEQTNFFTNEAVTYRIVAEDGTPLVTEGSFTTGTA